MNVLLVGGHGIESAPTLARYQPIPHAIARIHLLGSMRATSYLGDDILPYRKKARALLAYLCLASSGKVSRERLASLLWDTSSEERARTSLRQNLSDVSSAMGPLAAELISAGRGTIALNVNACWIDARALQSGDDQTRSDLAHLCTGSLLDGLDNISTSFDLWLKSERARFAERLKAPARGSSEPRPERALLSAIKRQHSLPGRNRLRVAVLPFHGRQTREENLSASLSHDIAAALARFRWFDVVDAISTVRGEDLHQFDYVVDGSVGQHSGRVEVNIRLLDLTRSTQPVWSERFELPTGELHRLNELVTPRVVGSIDPVILFIEGQPKRRDHYGATGLLLLAIPLLYSMQRSKVERAGELIEQALKIDPQNAMAFAWSALWHLAHTCHGWTKDIAGTLTKAEALSLQAIKLDPENAEALGIYAHTCAWRKNFDTALQYFDRSLLINPNLAFVWPLSALTYCYIGQPVEALKRLKRYRDLAPFDPHSSFFETPYVIAYTLKGDYEQAVMIGRGVVKANPEFGSAYKPLIAALGHLGRPDEAKPFIDKLRTLEPGFTVEHFQQFYPLKNDSDRDLYAKGLRLAGVPEC